jgi:hypothetical protein
MKDGDVQTADSSKHSRVTYAIGTWSIVLTLFCCCGIFISLNTETTGCLAAAGACVLTVTLITFNILILVDYTLRVNELENVKSQTETEYSKKMGKIFACTGYSVGGKEGKDANDLK